MSKEQNTNITNTADIYGNIERLPCLESMVEYYQSIYKSISHLVGHKLFMDASHLSYMSFEQVRDLRRYINADLDNLSTEFYLQRTIWALECSKKKKKDGESAHRREAMTNPAQHPCLMKTGFEWITSGEVHRYTYEAFLGDTLPIFVAIHNHLVSINRALGDLYYYVTEAPFSSFTPTGKKEIRNLTSQLNGIMQGLLIATHLQPQFSTQNDLVSYLVSCRADCQHFFDTIPRYYQTHRMRLVVFPIDLPVPEQDPYNTREPLVFPATCLPWSAGLYVDFLTAYRTIALHVIAVLVWAVRLYSIWYFVPRRYLRLIAPMGTVL